MSIAVDPTDGRGQGKPSAAGAAGTADDFGRHIREARRQRGLTTEKLAELTGLSRSYLSNVERNVNSPTISTLRVILDALGVSLSELFRSVDAEQRILTRPEQRVELARTGNSSVRYELLNPDPTGRLELLLMTVAPGGSSGELPHTHAGEEVGLLLQGTLEYWVDNVHYAMEAGDSLSFTSTTPHRYANTGTAPSVSIWCVTPPSF
jgi:transcriptional regulator with XRE-family HTH domain